MSLASLLTLAGAALFGLLLLAVLGLYIHDRWISKDNILRNFPVKKLTGRITARNGFSP